MENPILLILHFLETLIMTYMGGVLFNFSSRNPSLFAIVSLINGIFIYTVRSIYIQYGIQFGSHTFIIFVFYCMLLKIILDLSNRKLICTALVGYIIVIASDITLAPVLVKLLWEPQLIVDDPVKHLIVGLLNSLPMVLIIAIVLLKERFQNLINEINN